MIRYCTACGASISAEERAKPHPHCAACGTTQWQSPKPVAVLLQPVRRFGGSLGLLIIQRGIEPFVGGWALPGGFIEKGESAEEAAFRERGEETGVLPSDADGAVLALTLPTPGGQLLTFVGNSRVLDDTEVRSVFQPNPEALGWRIMSPDDVLCFELHQRVAEQAFASILGMALA